MLEEDFKSAILSKCRGMLTNGVVLHLTTLDLMWQQQPLKQFEN
jgi:hypothetical protein